MNAKLKTSKNMPLGWVTDMCLSHADTALLMMRKSRDPEFRLFVVGLGMAGIFNEFIEDVRA